MPRDSEFIRQSLLDGIAWQLGLADAWPEGSAERDEARDQAKAYRRILKSRYGSSSTKLDDALSKCKLVSMAECTSKERK